MLHCNKKAQKFLNRLFINNFNYMFDFSPAFLVFMAAVYIAM